VADGRRCMTSVFWPGGLFFFLSSASAGPLWDRGATPVLGDTFAGTSSTGPPMRTSRTRIDVGAGWCLGLRGQRVLVAACATGWHMLASDGGPDIPGRPRRTVRPAGSTTDRVDPAGRFWTGSLEAGEPDRGRLYRWRRRRVHRRGTRASSDFHGATGHRRALGCLVDSRADASTYAFDVIGELGDARPSPTPRPWTGIPEDSGRDTPETSGAPSGTATTCDRSAGRHGAPSRCRCRCRAGRASPRADRP